MIMWKAIHYSPEHLHGMLEMAQEHYGMDNDIANDQFITYQYFERC